LIDRKLVKVISNKIRKKHNKLKKFNSYFIVIWNEGEIKKKLRLNSLDEIKRKKISIIIHCVLVSYWCNVLLMDLIISFLFCSLLFHLNQINLIISCFILLISIYKKIFNYVINEIKCFLFEIINAIRKFLAIKNTKKMLKISKNILKQLI